mgnify:CR=1 FL=1
MLFRAPCVQGNHLLHLARADMTSTEHYVNHGKPVKLFAFSGSVPLSDM